MKNSALWPVVSGLVLLLVGSLAIEVSARRRDGETIVIKIVDNELSNWEGAVDNFAESVPAALSDEHAFARQLAKRRDYAQALVIYEKLLAQRSNDAPLIAEYAHWLGRDGQLDKAREQLLAAKQAAPSDPNIALELGFALAQSDDERASEEFQRAMALRPNHSKTRIALGDLLRRKNRLQEAISVLAPAARNGSNEERARALTVLGRCHIAAGEVAKGRPLLREAVERAPASVNTWLGAAYAYLDSDDSSDVERALEHTLKVIQLAPEAALAHRLLARIHERRGAQNDAILAYRQALTLDPSSVAARERLLRLSLDGDDLETAREQARALLELKSTEAEYHFLAGLVEARAELYGPAREHYRKAAELRGGRYPEAWFNLGKVEGDAANADLAIEAYLRAIEEKPDYAAAWNNLGRSYLDKGASEEALAAFEKAIELAPSYGLAWHNLGRLHYREERYEQAATAYQRAVELSPHDRSLMLKLAITLRKTGQEGRAIQTYRKLLEQQPRFVAAWFNLGVALAAAGRTDEALAAYQKALELAPDHAASLKNLGYLEARSGHNASALAYLNDALDHEPSDVDTRLKLAELHLLEADPSSCRAEVLRALAQDHENLSAQAMLARCGQ